MIIKHTKDGKPMTKSEATQEYNQANEWGEVGMLVYEVMTQWLLGDPPKEEVVKVLMLMEGDKDE